MKKYSNSINILLIFSFIFFITPAFSQFDQSRYDKLSPIYKKMHSQIDYQCKEAYHQKLGLNYEYSDSEKESRAEVIGGLAVGGGTLVSILATKGFSVLIFAIYGSIAPAALGVGIGYLLANKGKNLKAIFRNMRFNPYFKANHAIVLSNLNDKELQLLKVYKSKALKKDPIAKLVMKLNRKSLEVNYQAVKSKIAELSQTKAFCAKEKAVRFNKMKKILINEFSVE